MALVPLPNGAKLSLATTIGAAVAISAISNASPAVAATAAPHGYNDNDLVLLSLPGLSKIDNQVRRVLDGVDASHFILPGVDSTNLTAFPPGAGVGSARAITGWTPISKVPGFETTGGDAKTGTTSYLDSDKDLPFISGENATMLNIRVSHQPGSAQEQALMAASDSGELQVLRLTLKTGAQLFYVGELHFNPNPTTSKDAEMTNGVMLALQSTMTRFPKVV